MSIDLSNLGPEELQQLISDARARLEAVKKQRFSEMRKSLEAQAKAAGYNIGELFGFGGEGRASAASSGEKRPVAPKYRNPANHLQTWTGRGKHPHWVRDALASGKSLSDLAI